MALCSCSPQLRAIHLSSSLRQSPSLRASSLRVQPLGLQPRRRWSIRCSSSSSAAAGPDPESPYLTLGVSALEKFEVIKGAYGRRRKDAENRGDEALVERLDKAYDRIMMLQLSNRKQGLAFGGQFAVSKEIKYADKRSWFPWGPRKATSEKNDVLINLGISLLFSAWIAFTGQAEWKPLQFMIFGYIFRVFNKLKEYEAPVAAPSFDEEGGEEGGRPDSGARLRNGKRLLRTLGLVFSCVAVASLAYTGILNAFELAGQYIPRAFMGAQELFVTVATAVSLFIMASFFR